MGGADPATFSLRDWLDSGYAFLVREADPTARQLLDELFASENAEAMKAGFDALREEMNWRRGEAEAAEREAQKRARKAGGKSRPRPTRRVSQAELDAAAAAWS